jgi:methanogenic corrinoid protein MtbC1
MEKTIKAIRDAGLGAKVIIGGCPVSETVCKAIKADAWAKNPQDTVRTCRDWAIA